MPSDEPMSDEDKAAMRRYDGTGHGGTLDQRIKDFIARGPEPHEAPERNTDGYAQPSRLCLCGLRWKDHYDGWSGSRLDCTEANRRHRMGQILGR